MSLVDNANVRMAKTSHRILVSSRCLNLNENLSCLLAIPKGSYDDMTCPTNTRKNLFLFFIFSLETNYCSKTRKRFVSKQSQLAHYLGQSSLHQITLDFGVRKKATKWWFAQPHQVEQASGKLY